MRLEQIIDYARDGADDGLREIRRTVIDERLNGGQGIGLSKSIINVAEEIEARIDSDKRVIDTRKEILSMIADYAEVVREAAERES